MTRPPASDANTLARMKRQKRQGTRPEVIVKQQIASLGLAYRLNSDALPGSPDLSNQTRGWAIFVHGCYWHAHPGCPKATVPRNNREWWSAKFRRNTERDAQHIQALEHLGLRVLVVWECETKDPSALRLRLETWLQV
jgi:DNA mismatch endonuclease (patch repair protein)